MANNTNPFGASPTMPGVGFVAVTKSDATLYSPSFRAIYIGTGGDVSLVPGRGGTAVVFKNMQAGTLIPVEVYQVMSTSTTAADIVGIY